MQSLPLFLQIKNDLLNTVWLAPGEKPPQEAEHARSSEPSRTGHRRRRVMPEYLEHFNDLVLEAASEGLTDDAQGMFSRLFEGTVESDDSDNPPPAGILPRHARLCHQDRCGRIGDGLVVSDNRQPRQD